METTERIKGNQRTRTRVTEWRGGAREPETEGGKNTKLDFLQLLRDHIESGLQLLQRVLREKLALFHLQPKHTSTHTSERSITTKPSQGGQQVGA
jgi:hypothetical protein